VGERIGREKESERQGEGERVREKGGERGRDKTGRKKSVMSLQKITNYENYKQSNQTRIDLSSPLWPLRWGCLLGCTISRTATSPHCWHLFVR
jgi:hypothetical protein